MQEQSVRIGSRQLQRFSKPWRLQYKAVRKYGRRYETAPGDHMQIDFCEKTVMDNNEAVKIHVFVAALVFSRRIFAKAYPAKNQTAWLDGIKSAFFRRVREPLSAATPDVWFAPTTAAAQPNGRKPIAIRSQKVRWKEQCAMYKAMPCKANRSKVRRQSIIGWSTGP